MPTSRRTLDAPGRIAYAPPAAEARPHAPDFFDAAWAESLERVVLTPMLEQWFRAEVVGGENIPAEGPVILAANHSGNAFPYDAMMLDALLWRRDGMRPAAKMRTVYEHQLSLRWWMRPFGIADFWRRGGGVDMTFDNFDRLLARGDRVVYFPEGVPGIGKGFDQRYRLQRFSTSFILLAARHGTPVIPVYIVNGEWLHPFGYTFRPLDWVMAKVFGVPFLPLPIGLLAIVFPFVWYLAFPARLRFVVGRPLDIAGALAEEGFESLENPARLRLRRVANRIRETMQRELDANVATHGRTRYGFRELWRALRSRPHPLRATPLGWPLTFIRHERDRQRPTARGRLHALLRDWDLAAFYLPFGWPLLSLARALRRPPYGHFGVPRARRRRDDGEFLWCLSEEPLPPRDGRH